MATIKLNLETNVAQSLQDASQQFSTLNNKVDEFEKSGKQSFIAVSKESENLTANIKKAATESITASNKIISGKDKERIAIALIKSQIAEIVEQEKKLKILQENTVPGKVRSDLNSKLAETRFDLKEMQKELVLMEANEKKLIEPVISLKSQLRKAKEELAEFEQGSDAFNEAAKKAGNLQDKIKDAGDATAAFAADSKTATAGTLFSQIGSDISSLDFKGAADKAKQFAIVMKSITLSETLGGLKSLGSALLNIGKALLANPFFILVAAIVAVGVAIKGMVDSLGAGDESLKTTRENLKGVTDATNDLARATRDLAIENDISLKKVTASDGEKLKSQNKFKDEYLKVLQKQRAEVDILNASIESERLDDGFKGTKSLFERLGGETELTKKHKKGLKEIEESYSKELAGLRANFTEESRKINIEALLQTEKDAIDANAKAKAQREKDAADLLKYREELAAALLDLAKRAIEAEISGLFGRDKLDAQNKQAAEELEALRKSIIEKQVLAGEGNKLSVEAEAEFAKLSLRNAKLFADGLLQIDIEAAKLNAEQQQKSTDTKIQGFELQQRAAIAAAELARNPGGMSDEDYELIRQRNILQIKKKGLEDGIKLQVDSFEVSQLNRISADEEELKTLEGRTDEVSLIKRQALERDIALIKSNTPIEIGVLNAENDVKIKAITDNIEKQAKAIPEDILNFDKLLGVPAGTVAKAMSDIKSLTDSLFEFQQQQLDAELSIIDKRQEARDNEISDLQSKLDEEKDLKKQGLANNVDTINAEIEAKKAAGLADIELQKKIQAEKKKLALAQFAIDSALQASTMGLAIATTLKTYATAPPVAIAFAALQVAAFIAQRALALKAINQQSNFKDGVIDLQGPGSETSDSIPANLSRRESVMTAKETKANKPLFLGIRNKDNSLIEIGIRDLLKNTGISLDKGVPNELSKMKSDARSNEISILMPKRDSENDSRIVSIEKNIAELVKQGGESSYLNENGNLVKVKGSLTQIIRKKI